MVFNFNADFPSSHLCNYWSRSGRESFHDKTLLKTQSKSSNVKWKWLPSIKTSLGGSLTAEVFSVISAADKELTSFKWNIPLHRDTSFPITLFIFPQKKISLQTDPEWWHATVIQDEHGRWTTKLLSAVCHNITRHEMCCRFLKDAQINKPTWDERFNCYKVSTNMGFWRPIPLIFLQWHYW